MNRLAVHIKRFFTPTEQDEMLPLGLGQEAFFLYFLLALVIILSPVYVHISELASLGSPDIVDSQAKTLITLVNQERVAGGLPILKENLKLDQAASLKIDDMFTNQYFAHFSPIDNTSPWDFFRAADYRYYAAGENLAVDFITAEQAHTALMNSPTHRANIMSPLFTEIGISVKQGTWSNHSSIMIAQYFGKERVTLQATSGPSAASTSAPVPAPIIPAPTPTPIAVQPVPPVVSNVEPVQVLGTNTEPTQVVPPLSGEQRRTTSEQLEAPAPTDMLPAPEPLVVEPTPLPAPLPLTVAPSTGDKLVQLLTVQNEVKMLSLVAILSLLVSLMFLMIRSERLSVPIAMRTLVLLVLFGYIAIFGVGEFSMSAIPSPPAAQIIVGSM